MINKQTSNVVATSAALLAAMTAPPARSMFMQHAMEKIPVARMLANLEGQEKQAKTDKDRAMREFQIGRLHSMAYAQKTEQVDATKPTKESPNPEPFYGFYTGDHTQFGIEPAKSEAQKKSAQKHLSQAIANLRSAVKLDPTLIPAQLGLAWCLDQSGKKDEALSLYRQVFAAAWEKENKREHGLEGASITKETGQYMLKLLNPTKDAAEIADVNAKCEKVNKIFRAVTPIVVPVSPGLSADQLLDRASVTFDLDGNGPRTYSKWTNARSGWLVYDGGAGGITSGLQMFGQCTFWVFWRNGYEALSLYRQVFAAAWEKENKREHGLEGASITKETGQYMLKLLNPTKDAAEIADVNAKCEKVNKIFRAVTPIVVPVSPGLSADQLLDRASVTFDLDGNGPRTYSKWTNARSGWLVYDGGAGGITSGLQMFGQCTFWVFWRNGYEALSALDDNHDGELRGSELEKLAVWQDRNQNGVCEGGELRSLASLNIEALACRYAKDPSGLLFSLKGVQFADGATAATYDVVLEEKTD